jgi:hypothetical protein
VEADSESLAFLPRGHTLDSEPDFLYGPGSGGVLTVAVTGEDESRTLRLPLPDTHGKEIARVTWPSDWHPLPSGASVVWTIERPGEIHQATFTVATSEERRGVGKAFARFLTRDVPARSREFFRGHYYLNRGYLAKAGFEFGVLSGKFPDRAYPRDEVERIADALSLDPSIFLR